jgi:hypothetical protein
MGQPPSSIKAPSVALASSEILPRESSALPRTPLRQDDKGVGGGGGQERQFGRSPEVWMRLQAAYDLKKSERDKRVMKRIARIVPLNGSEGEETSGRQALGG